MKSLEHYLTCQMCYIVFKIFHYWKYISKVFFFSLFFLQTLISFVCRKTPFVYRNIVSISTQTLHIFFIIIYLSEPLDFFFLVSHQSHTHQCIHVNLNLPIHHTTTPPSPPCRFPPLVSIRLFSTSVSQFLLCKPVHLYHFLGSTFMR